MESYRSRTDMTLKQRLFRTSPGQISLAGHTVSGVGGLALGLSDGNESNVDFWCGLVAAGGLNSITSGVAGLSTRKAEHSKTAQYFIWSASGAGFSAATFTACYVVGTGLRKFSENVYPLV
ncbi:hypothetical protein HOC80_00325 [archaeon]|jgi:hypothetical protein|nr:hypothetical protein [archaeon]MBT4416530.1 hypothetical protein [archaeon]